MKVGAVGNQSHTVKMYQDFSSLEKLAIRNVMERVWRPHLLPDERDFLAYVYDNTIEWGRATLDVTLDQMVNGVPSDHAEWTWRLAPVGYPRSTLKRLIQRLKDKGALLVSAIRHRCTKITLNFLWSPAENVKKLPIPKRLQGKIADVLDELGEPIRFNLDLNDGPIRPDLGLNDEAIRSDLDLNEEAGEGDKVQSDTYSPSIRSNLASNKVQSGPSNKQHVKQHEEKQHENYRTAAPTGGDFSEEELEELGGVGQSVLTAKEHEEACPPPTAAEIIRDTAIHSAEGRAQRLAAIREKDTADAYQATFLAAWEETYPGIPAPLMTKRDGFQLRAVLASHLLKDNAGRHEFLDFTVRHWEAIVADKFTWMTKAPAPKMPSQRFLIGKSFFGTFLDAFAERNRYRDATLSVGEDGEIKRLMRAGLSRENALKKIGETQGANRAKAQEREVKVRNTDIMRQAQATYDKLQAAQKQAFAERAKAAKAAKEAPKSVPDPAAAARAAAIRAELADEIGPYTGELIDLPPYDPKDWA
ncbi:hypothetical protein ACN2CC_02145 [Mesorhizobium muleiense]|uniref:hypothetical protein n=1 Tax=Mesorhizobium muleiense TaxID=1004279 RepID=UPI003AFA3388